MDISAIRPSERTIEIKHPVSGENLGIRITLMSPDDDRLKPTTRAIQDKRIYLNARNKSFSAEEIEANNMKLFVASVTGWEWYSKDVTFEGKKPDFTPENVRKVLTTLPWFRAQLDDELSETKSFFA